MTKNSKGFFLAETVVMVALVSVVMIFLYPNLSKLYDNYENRSMYYDQPQDLYYLKWVSEYYNNDIYIKTDKGCETNLTSLNDPIINNYIHSEGTKDFNIGRTKKTVYVVNYMANLNNADYNFQKYLNRIKKTSYDATSYRLIGVFEKLDDSGETIETRYASIKIDNPNPDRNCNLGGKLDD